MKTLLKSFLWTAVATLGVSAFAAPENHEEFARQYMPESQAVFERFRKDCAESKRLQVSLAEDLRVMNRAAADDAGYCALSEKIAALEKREAEWAVTIKDAFFRHKAGLITAEKLGDADLALAKRNIAWESGVLKNLIKNFVAGFGVPELVEIPGCNYAFGKYEITQEQFRFIMGKNPSYFRGNNRPVESVTWEEAAEFCLRLTERERALGRLPKDREYRLPSLEEWEHACRAGVTTESPVGDTAGDLLRFGWYSENSERKTHPVGQKPPNAFGLYDMCGNVSEWTRTLFDDRLACHGGDWSDCVSNVYTAAMWYKRSPEERFNYLGFRVVLAEAEEE
ncbi:MAG: formylglycine-generating enzyme family protein [Opitutales bacterium]|nr:formylglycine-generating enzyme family protein [Opitutales bacterium]